MLAIPALPAADADMVFGVVAEELGLIIAIICMLVIVLFAFFAIRSSAAARSSFYVIAAGAAVTMFLTQTILTVFGALDVIPFTGVTFPFVSRGGSSMLVSWGMLAFIKAADTRQNASLAVRLDRRAIRQAKRGERYDDMEEYDDPSDVYDDYEEYHKGDALTDGIAPQYFDGHPPALDTHTWEFCDGWEDSL